jgi:hypothetical protein
MKWARRARFVSGLGRLNVQVRPGLSSRDLFVFASPAFRAGYERACAVIALGKSGRIALDYKERLRRLAMNDQSFDGSPNGGTAAPGLDPKTLAFVPAFARTGHIDQPRTTYAPGTELGR